VSGRRTDTRGRFWEFDIDGLPAGREHRLELRSSRGRALAEPWTIATFPAPDSDVDPSRYVSEVAALTVMPGPPWPGAGACQKSLIVDAT
jgi:hypothetical protein